MFQDTPARSGTGNSAHTQDQVVSIAPQDLVIDKEPAPVKDEPTDLAKELTDVVEDDMVEDRTGQEEITEEVSTNTDEELEAVEPGVLKPTINDVDSDSDDDNYISVEEGGVEKDDI
uniref:Uncharacterized protein n=1 Tax=Eucampia antarctica TaxID=49252 RepID=A0A7S2S2P7_9STRA|mmetsp:Transcript_30146/g.29029  ORF Transcript_30146/g.29029 Transcript_30146/m.29029 type:complete len:117 (+) Transcript_30146:58-408(+)|eukprot:CAMPEP_0197842918 /NCGR_PEP_ID=MMETSP1437-20131217/47019_1 /TAXON_ID=49252 ORGANISM="Eucampia antarctica, Strain CCMP1452" /NCGR_SAMPLE_ID=MMETSP1437 /ASSEMBLY_ACC=CAM_ASM_001096 /LENGTH=116 /DNA_ID=CAMNT_0043452873 /DNA_START=813 /DNA_END=1163 /DNA_ORIENTATION=-